MRAHLSTDEKSLSGAENIDPWKIFTPKIFTPEKYSTLKNIHHWKIFNPGRLNDWTHKHVILWWYILVIFCSTAPPLPSLSAGDDVVYEQSLSYYQLKQSTLGKGAGEVPPQSYISTTQLHWKSLQINPLVLKSKLWLYQSFTNFIWLRGFGSVIQRSAWK